MKFRSYNRRLNEARIEANLPKSLERVLKEVHAEIRNFEVVKYVTKDGSADFIVDIDLNFGNGVQIRSDFEPRDEGENIRAELSVSKWGSLGSWDDDERVRALANEVIYIANTVKDAATVLENLQAFTVEDLMIVK